jgi:hypothetical protein
MAAEDSSTSKTAPVPVSTPTADAFLALACAISTLLHSAQTTEVLLLAQAVPLGATTMAAEAPSTSKTAPVPASTPTADALLALACAIPTLPHSAQTTEVLLLARAVPLGATTMAAEDPSMSKTAPVPASTLTADAQVELACAIPHQHQLALLEWLTEAHVQCQKLTTGEFDLHASTALVQRELVFVCAHADAALRLADSPRCNLLLL